MLGFPNFWLRNNVWPNYSCFKKVRYIKKLLAWHIRKYQSIINIFKKIIQDLTILKRSYRLSVWPTNANWAKNEGEMETRNCRENVSWKISSSWYRKNSITISLFISTELNLAFPPVWGINTADFAYYWCYKWLC